MNIKKENEGKKLGKKKIKKIKKQKHAHRKCSKYIHASDIFVIHNDSHKEATNMTFQATLS